MSRGDQNISLRICIICISYFTRLRIEKYHNNTLKRDYFVQWTIGPIEQTSLNNYTMIRKISKPIKIKKIKFITCLKVNYRKP